MISVIVAIILVMGGVGKQMKIFGENSLEFSAVGVSMTEEAISSIQVATAFGVQDHLTSKYDDQMRETSRLNFRSKAALSLMITAMMCILNLQYGLTFWQGGVFLSHGNISAVASARKIFATIDRISPIDSETGSGDKLDRFGRKVTFDSVRLVYPSGPGVAVFNDVSLTIPSGKTTVILGPSGSGKSSLPGLIESLNLRWLRSQMSLIGQDSVLFKTTIYNNIAHDLLKGASKHAINESTDSLVEKAARIANAYDFISGLPQGYDTVVGESGNLLSSSLKQRMAIAKALLRAPWVLLLDEATSALDSESEWTVQLALDRVAASRTMIAICHRLSTIQNADLIYVLDRGRVAEKGRHGELIARKGKDWELVELQRLGSNGREAEREQ
ncbi:hypothetical protein DV736_g1073, partial [Chaetothyriales sp. CBS 134916]